MDQSLPSKVTITLQSTEFKSLSHWMTKARISGTVLAATCTCCRFGLGIIVRFHFASLRFRSTLYSSASLVTLSWRRRFTSDDRFVRRISSLSHTPVSPPPPLPRHPSPPRNLLTPHTSVALGCSTVLGNIVIGCFRIWCTRREEESSRPWVARDNDHSG